MDQQTQQKLMQIQQQLQTVMMRKESLKTQKNEIDRALEELGDGDETYRSVGTILIRRDPEDLADELEEEKEDLDMKISSLQRKEDQLKEKLQESQSAMRGDTSGDGPVAS